MSSAPSAAFTFTGAAGSLLKLSTTAAASVIATVDDLSGVKTVGWSVIATDETDVVATRNATIVSSGTLGSICTLTAATAGTGGRLKCLVNSGLVDEAYAIAKFHVPHAGGHEVLTTNEVMESNATFGWAEPVNEAIRSASAAAVKVAHWQKDTDDAMAATLTAEVPIFEAATGQTITLTAIKWTSSATITADNTDNITITIRRRDGAGGAAVTVVAYTMNVASGAPVLNIPKSLGTLANTTLTVGNILTLEVTKGGVGRVLFAGTLSVFHTVA